MVEKVIKWIFLGTFAVGILIPLVVMILYLIAQIFH